MSSRNAQREQQEQRQVWDQRIAQQQSSGESIRAFCRERGLKEHAFYSWRQRLRSRAEQPVTFALVETKPVTAAPTPFEFLLPSGARLLIPANEAALRMVLGVLREPV